MSYRNKDTNWHPSLARCKSSKVDRAKSIGGDMWTHIGMLRQLRMQRMRRRELVVLDATNKKLSLREVEMVWEAMVETDAGFK